MDREQVVEKMAEAVGQLDGFVVAEVNIDVAQGEFMFTAGDDGYLVTIHSI